MRFGRLVGLVLVAWMLAAGAAVRVDAQPVADDPFTGSTIVSSTGGTVQPEALFDGGDAEPNQATFFPGFILDGEVVFATPPLTLAGIRLHAATDGAFHAFRRSMSHFRLFADTDSDGTAAEQVVDQAVHFDYNSGQAGDLDAAPNELEMAFTFAAPVTAARWRVVVTGLPFIFDAGPRVQEIDAVPVAASGSQSQSPTPTPTTTSPASPVPGATDVLSTTSSSGRLPRTGPAGTEPWGVLLLLAGGGLWLVRSAARRRRRSAP